MEHVVKIHTEDSCCGIGMARFDSFRWLPEGRLLRLTSA